MKRNLNEAIGAQVDAEDGSIGKVIDFYLDEHKWTIRYLVIEAGGWLNRHKVLLAPMAFKKFNWESNEFIVDYKKEKVRNSPDIVPDKTISRQYEIELHNYYSWPAYWEANDLSWAPTAFDRKNASGVKVPFYIPKGDPSLRSIKETTGYNMQANYEKIGHVESFFVDDETWIISYMLGNSKELMSGKKFLISPLWVTEVSWINSEVFVDLTREAIKYCPEFDYSKTISPDYEAKLNNYYSNARDLTSIGHHPNGQYLI